MENLELISGSKEINSKIQKITMATNTGEKNQIFIYKIVQYLSNL